MLTCPGMPEFNPMNLLHGEQKITIIRPLKFDTDYLQKMKFTDVADKGKGASLEFTIEVFELDDKKNQHLAFVNVSTVFIRGIGGFGYKGCKP